MRRHVPALLLLVALLFALLPGSAAADAPAVNLAPRCAFTASASVSALYRLKDGSRAREWTCLAGRGTYIQVTVPTGFRAASLYLMWNDAPRPWKLIASHNGAFWKTIASAGRCGMLNELVTVPSGYRYLRIVSESSGWKMRLGELQVWSAGALPATVQQWRPTPAKADLMVFSAHPDDEMLYFGGTLPYYAGQLGKRTVTVYVSGCSFPRRLEALNALYLAGVRDYPVFLGFTNTYTSTLADTSALWGLDRTVGAFTELLRKHQPDVVVTHDVKGEYGHGHHIMTAYAVQKSVLYSGTPSRYPASANAWGLWTVKKCYLRLYPVRPIRMNWRVPLPRFGGKTALDMARLAYDRCYVSQHFRPRPIEESGPYDCTRYGLYFTAVGDDTGAGDFFENIVPALPPAPSPTPEPTPPPEPTTAPSPMPPQNYPTPGVQVTQLP